MAVTPIQKSSSILRPRARIIKTIGEELISDDKVALLELVKNSYDADASLITIQISGNVIIEDDGKKKIKKIVKDGSSIIVTDNGSGMNLNTIITSWMEPATISKKNDKRSEKGRRRYTGEKGIGRFASAKLSSHLRIISRVAQDNEVVVDFNWKDFDDNSRYLDQVKFEMEVREPEVFTKRSHGTQMILTDLNAEWDEEKIRQLRITLQRLINPVSPVTGFTIVLDLPADVSEYSGVIEPIASLTKPRYAIFGEVDETGKPTITYTNGKNGLVPLQNFSLLKKDEAFLTGPFKFEFRVWDLDSDSLNDLAKETSSSRKDIKDALDEIAGISIYRDQFRVLPYGDPKFDWVRLDLRRVNNPTMRISNNQIIGFISIELDKNPEFKDQSNREGLIESKAFTQLKEFIKRILNELEVKRYEERPRAKDSFEIQKNLFTKFSLGLVAQLIRTKLPNDKEANDAIDKAESDLRDGVKKVREVLSRYRRLSTLGNLVDLILHDGNNFLGRLDSEAELLSRELTRKELNLDVINEHVDNIQDVRKTLAQLFKRIEPFGGRKRGLPTNIVIEDAISNVFSLYKGELEKLHISCDLPVSSNTVQIDSAELQMILLNLLQNAIYWLETVEDRKITVLVEKQEAEISVIFSDSGPGIKEEHQQMIFDPYFSTRPDGIGLGLTMVGELVSEYDGDFDLIDNGPLDGTTFKVTFRKRI